MTTVHRQKSSGGFIQQDGGLATRDIEGETIGDKTPCTPARLGI
jgi:hypothetical protein